MGFTTKLDITWNLTANRKNEICFLIFDDYLHIKKPEDPSVNGSFWNHLASAGVNVLNFHSQPISTKLYSSENLHAPLGTLFIFGYAWATMTTYSKVHEIGFMCKRYVSSLMFNRQVREILLIIPMDTGRKLNVHKTFRWCPGRLRNVLCTSNLRPLSTGKCRNLIVWDHYRLSLENRNCYRHAVCTKN